MSESGKKSMARDVVRAFGGDGPGNQDGATLSTALTAKKSDNRIEFGFQYRDIPFVVRAEAAGQGTAMEIRASLGDLPYTVEDPGRRMTAYAIVQAASKGLGGRIMLDGNQRIVLSERYQLDEPLTPQALLTRAVRLVLEAKPYLELLELVVKPPLAAAARYH